MSYRDSNYRTPPKASGSSGGGGGSGGPAPPIPEFEIVVPTAVSAERVIALVAGVYALAQPTAAFGQRVIGVSKNSAGPGQLLKIATDGDRVEVHGLLEGPVYLATNGTLTNIAPATGLLQQIGIVLDGATTMLVQSYPAIWRG